MLDRGPSVTATFIDLVNERLPGNGAAVVFDDQGRSGPGPRDGGDMRCHGDAWVAPKGVSRRQGFNMEDVQNCPAKLATVEYRQEIGIGQMRSARCIDQAGTIRQLG
jgi:hypothetical protein